MAKPAPAEAMSSRRLHPTAKKILAASKRILTERGYRGLTTAGDLRRGGRQQGRGLVLLRRQGAAGARAAGGGRRDGVAPLRRRGRPPDATLDERIELLVGSAEQVQERVERFAAFYELLPEASRDAELRAHLMTYYQAWYDWAAGVLPPSDRETTGARPTSRPVRLAPARRPLHADGRRRSRTSTSRQRCEDARAALTYLAGQAGGPRP